MLTKVREVAIMSSPELTGWILTYAIHSTALLVAAWVISGRVKSHRIRETLWKTALFGGFFTATGQTLLRSSSLGGRMLMPAVVVQPSQADTPSPGRDPVAPDAPDQNKASDKDQEEAAVSSARARALPPVETLFAAAWLLGAVVLLGRYLLRRALFERRIAARREVLGGPVADMLQELCDAAGITRPIRLTASAALPSPVALGRAEIAMPEAAFTDLDPGQQRSMLAHELAHLDRGDPRWLTASCLAECVGFLQPLNRLARRRLMESAEYLCDEWAVRRTGSGVLLAKCLAKVAEWLETAPRTLPVAGMAEDRSHLVARVRRLLDGAPFPRSPGRKTLMFGSFGIIAATVLALPAVSLARHPAPSSPQAAGSVEAATIPAEAAGAQAVRADTGRAIVNALMSVIKDPNVEVRRAATRSLGQHEDRTALPALREALRDEDAEVRQAALEALSNMEDAASADAIAALIKDPNKEVRAAAIEALTNLELTSPPAGLREALRDPDADVRHQAAHAVGHFEDASAVPALALLLEDKNADVREAAVEALANIRNEPAIQALIGALKAKDPKLRQAAADALGKRN
jgi:beta-lactamase regulating signal transducer with metallopeptidase domain